MGRLSRSGLKKVLTGRVWRLVFRWGVPLALSIAIVFGVNAFARADTPPTASELAQYLQTNELNLGVDSVDGYQQVYYLYKSNKIFITAAPYSHTNPVSSGEYVTWEGIINGSGQIYVYDVLTQALTQITSVGANQNPALYGNLVMWESWTGDRWAIDYSDGISSFALTSGQNSAVRPSSNGTQIIFAQQESDGWKAYSYDLTDGQYTVLGQGDEASTAYPKFATDGSVTTDIGNYSRG